jgi:hypothetical protein
MKSIMKSILFGMTLIVAATPAHSAILFFDSFESGDFTHAENGFGWNGRSSGSGDLQPAITTATAHSGTRSVKFTFGAGAATEDAWSELRYVLGKNMNEVYMQWYMYYPKGTEGLGPKWQHRQVQPDNNKFFKLWADSYSPYTVATGVSTWSNSTQNDVYFTEYGTNLTGGVGPFGKDRDYAGATDARLGKWLKVQIRVKCATAANNNGVIQMWIDDVMILNDTALNLYPSGGIGNHLRNGYLMGWMNSGFDVTSSMYIDDVTISDAFIGGVPLKPPVAQ